MRIVCFFWTFLSHSTHISSLHLSQAPLIRNCASVLHQPNEILFEGVPGKYWSIIEITSHLLTLSWYTTPKFYIHIIKTKILSHWLNTLYCLCWFSHILLDSRLTKFKESLELRIWRFRFEFEDLQTALIYVSFWHRSLMIKNERQIYIHMIYI